MQKSQLYGFSQDPGSETSMLKVMVNDFTRFNKYFKRAEGRWVPLSRTGCDVGLEGLYTERVALYRTRYGGPSLVEGAIGSDSLAVFLIEPQRCDVRVNGAILHQDEMIISCAGAEYVSTGGARETLAMLLPVKDFQGRVAALLGSEPRLDAPRYRVQLTPASARHLRRLLREALAWRGSERNALVREHLQGVVADQFCELAGTKLVAGSASTLAERGRDAIVKNAREILDACISHPISLSDLCQQTGACAETLRLAFQDRYGLSPMRYLKLRRMHAARDLLRVGDPQSASVKGAALDCGFWEMGRFAVEYRKYFGESPSVTLRSGDALA